MTKTIFYSSVPATGNNDSEFVKGSHRSSNLDKSYMEDFDDGSSVESSDPRFYVEGYDMPEYDNDREIETYLRELALIEEIEEYYANIAN
ncbi:hypothetical protein [uncultured Duncaniella sp.]|uniref:hypothetical protein n=1 Tax=uncultured Duncaniella sp. TaxID=2768039 RepID=UPI0025A95B50|nr:hypothetical protein [uncultured Duncaniella sp.]